MFFVFLGPAGVERILPEKLQKQVTAAWGERGARWLEGLPDLLEGLLQI